MIRSDFGSALVSGAQKSGALELVEHGELFFYAEICHHFSNQFSYTFRNAIDILHMILFVSLLACAKAFTSEENCVVPCAKSSCALLISSKI